MSYKSTITALLLLLASKSTSNCANVLTNGSFESPVVAANSYGARAVPDGWTGSPFSLNNGVAPLGCGAWGPPQDGAQYVDLGDYPGENLAQTFTVAAGFYQLTWYDNTANCTDAGPSPYNVLIIDTNHAVLSTIFDAGHGGVWQARRAQVQLADGEYTLIFTAEGYAGGWDTVLDNVALIFIAAQPGHFDSQKLLPDGSLLLSMSGTAYTNYTLQFTTDWTNWNPLATLSGTNGLFQYNDFAPTTNNSRFYRLVVGP
ncbi:MAG: hypothetical protein C5B50_06320 [Verrucomicrobia bacterium]|nr:MAG: hypothetical protein C5B50_06320 [Verrucomicrobiota bacterium]